MIWLETNLGFKAKFIQTSIRKLMFGFYTISLNPGYRSSSAYSLLSMCSLIVEIGITL